ncbi:MAG: AraC family transcriptional regulator [Lewinella sp.]|nr:AraC family transcriptional regulator [Lewinella sp.]
MANLIDPLVWAALFQGFLLGLLYITSNKYRSRANRLLGLFLWALVIEGLGVYLPVEYVGDYYLYNYFCIPEVKLFFPFLFLHYVLEKLGRSQAYWRILRFHYGLALLVLSLTLVQIVSYLLTGGVLQDYLGRTVVNAMYFAQQYYAFFWSAAAVIIAWRETNRYRKLVENEYTDLSMLEINWLWRFVMAIFPITLLWGAELLRIAIDVTKELPIVSVTWGLVVVFMYWVSYQAFRHNNLFEQAPEPEATLDNKPGPDAVQEDEHFQAACDELQAQMANRKYFLNQDLTLHDLARETGMSPRLISTCVNRQIGMNFSDWVNQFRVKEALQFLEDPTQNHLSVEGIGTNAVFKSRSAMYTAFKRHAGHPPGHFRMEEVS